MREKFGRWEVLGEGTSRVYKNGEKKRYCICKCECGAVKEVQLNSLKQGASESCGCLAKEVSSKHGESHSRLYGIHKAMKSRCTNKRIHAFRYYGSRGITYAPEWEAYETFRDWALTNGYEDHLTLDRINNDGNYNPENCRWVTMGEQSNNKSSNVEISWGGRTMNLSQWAEELGMNYNTLQSRIQRYGWSIEDAFTKEVKR